MTGGQGLRWWRRGVGIGWLAALPIVLAMAACGTTPPTVSPQVFGPTSGTVTVALTDYAFAPDPLILHAGVPISLRLENQSSGGHDFSAPAFFSTSSFPAGTTPPPNGRIEIAAHRTVTIMLTPGVPGSYPVECTHFLHSMFGMTATIQVVP